MTCKNRVSRSCRPVMTAARGQGRASTVRPVAPGHVVGTPGFPAVRGTRFHVLEVVDDRAAGGAGSSNRSVMTPGVAPRGERSVHASDRHMTDEQTTLSEFGGGGTEAGGDNVPTPAENAAAIQHLASTIERVTENVGSLVDQVGQHDDVGSIDTEPTDAAERMFQ